MTLKRSKNFAAVDLGAESGRVVTGAFDGRTIALAEVARFENVPVPRAGALFWDTSRLLENVVTGLRRAGELAAVGVDAWGCDYALIASDSNEVAPPRHYRDLRTRAAIEAVFDEIPRSELYARTGIQHLPFNTVFQLAADRLDEFDFAGAASVALIPDLFTAKLSGECVNEATALSTTGLGDPRIRAWDDELIKRLDLPGHLFTSRVVEPGTPLGEVLACHELRGRPASIAVASHDTASAFAAVPSNPAREALISCGTWSLVGVEVDGPVLTEQARAANLSNEWGIDGRSRLLRNVSGLWTLQQCRAEWKTSGMNVDYAELEGLAAEASDYVPLFDPDDELFLDHGPMTSRIAQWCVSRGQRSPSTAAEFVRSCLLSLACRCKSTLDDIAATTDRSIDLIHLVGGGARNSIFCQALADTTEAVVHAGPVEATAVGNILVQLRALGEIVTRDDMSECVGASFPPTVFEPRHESAYPRFLEVVSCGHERHEVADTRLPVVGTAAK